VSLTVIAGQHDGLRSPVETFSDMVYADLQLAPGARYALKAEHVERAIYVVEGSVAVTGQTGTFATGELIVFKPGAEILLHAEGGARLMLIGGEPLPEQRHIYWNFVSSRPERIEQAKADWRERRFKGVPDETDFIPLPDEPRPVRYP
jgi:redox-sensitive bicupin YhaK (pirin superfamily)